MPRIRLLLALTATAALSAAAAPFHADSFEEPAENWPADGRYWSASGTAAEGKRALMRCLYPGGKSGDRPVRIARKSAIPLPCRTFHISLRCQAAPVTPDLKLQLFLTYLNQAGTPCGVAALPLRTEGTGYTLNTLTAEAPPEARAILPELQIYGSDAVKELTYVRFDDLVLDDAPPPVAPPPAALKFTLPASPDRLNSVSAVVPGDFPVKGGERHHLSYRAKGGLKDTTVRSSLEAAWIDATGNVLGRFATDMEPPGVSHPYRNAAIADVPAGAVRARLTLRLASTRPQSKEVAVTFSEIALRPWEELLAEKRAEHAAFPETSRPIVLEPEDRGKWTSGSLSIGKFYRFSRPPRPMFADRGAGVFTDGTLLTDGETSDVKDFQIRRCVAFPGGQPLEITLKLGAQQQIRQVVFHHRLSHVGNLIAPSRVTIHFRADESKPWQLWKEQPLPSYQEGSGSVGSRVIGPPVMAGELKFSFPADGTPRQSVCFDEIEVQGRIKNTWKHVPARGLYHGAFTPTYAFKEPLRGGRKEPMSLQTYEKLVGKACSMVLWYQGLSPERRFTELAELRNRELAENHRGFRFMCVGWLPPETVKLADIADGALDEYLARYFRDSIDPALNLDNDTPLWFRPMNEFNSDWVGWGLDPDAFRRAWRRIFNIAEAVGATKRHIFVWSPNHLSYPNAEWNDMRNYWPGDQYVDWVGLSCYSPSMKFVNSTDELLPAARAREVNEYYGHYKPMMVAEGGYGADQDRVAFVRQWFEFEKLLPNFKAMIWENHNARCLQDVPEALEVYRKAVRSPYWIDNNTIQKP